MPTALPWASSIVSAGQRTDRPAETREVPLSADRDGTVAARVLIVEDEAIIAWELRTILEEFGYEVCGMSGKAAEAVRLAEEMEPHLVLMDVRLARGDDGVAAAAQIKAQRAIPIVFCTAFADPHTVARIEAVGAAGMLRKPICPRDLEALLRAVLAGDARN